MSPTLYDVSTEFARIELLLTEQGGEWTEEVEAAFLALGEMEKDRVDAYHHVIANLNAYRDGCIAESRRLDEKARVADNAAIRLKGRLLEYMRARDVTELKGEKWRAVIQKNGGKAPLVLLCEPDALPKHLQRVRIEADTDGIRAVLTNSGAVELAGVARLDQPGTHLRFR